MVMFLPAKRAPLCNDSHPSFAGDVVRVGVGPKDGEDLGTGESNRVNTALRAQRKSDVQVGIDSCGFASEDGKEEAVQSIPVFQNRVGVGGVGGVFRDTVDTPPQPPLVSRH